MRLSHTLLLATTNRNKFDEFTALFEAYPGIHLARADEILRNAEKLALVETHATYLENAIAKARLANHGSHYPSLADDSGLEVLALEGRPGPRSARFATPKAGRSQDDANIDKLLEELRGKSQRQARFVCTLALCIEGLTIEATGTLDGAIAEKPTGANGFGYDSVFVPTGASKSLAEMTSAEKNTISHRTKALRELMGKLQSHGITVAKP